MRCVICGMKITTNNFGMNNLSLLEQNEREDIKYCPFCGVTAKYLKTGGEKYRVNAESLDENTLIILDHAMKLETFNYEFYNAASKLAHSMEVKEIFVALANIERMHAIVNQNLGSFNELPKLVHIDYSKYKSDKSLMKLAENKETHAVKFYEKYAKEVSSLIVKEAFVALAEVERNHIRIASDY
ncbi:ferritin-like domain-containing protein [Clostridium sp.]|uniref:ferritin-like domain-containing protein n=1 Tax=Clostridium sp. TaxID=1506 RepID=UPI003D6CE016